MSAFYELFNILIVNNYSINKTIITICAAYLNEDVINDRVFYFCFVALNLYYT